MTATPKASPPCRPAGLPTGSTWAAWPSPTSNPPRCCAAGGWLGGERRCHAGRVERYKFVGPFPEQHVGREVVVDAPSDATTAVGVEVPTRRGGDILEGFGLLRHALQPPLQVDDRGDVVALLVVAAVMGRHEVVQPVIGQAGPGNEVVNFDRGAERFVAVEASALLELHERLAHSSEVLALTVEEEAADIVVRQFVELHHLCAPVLHDVGPKEGVQPREGIGHAGLEQDGPEDPRAGLAAQEGVDAALGCLELTDVARVLLIVVAPSDAVEPFGVLSADPLELGQRHLDERESGLIQQHRKPGMALRLRKRNRAVPRLRCEPIPKVSNRCDQAAAERLLVGATGVVLQENAARLVVLHGMGPVERDDLGRDRACWELGHRLGSHRTCLYAQIDEGQQNCLLVGGRVAPLLQETDDPLSDLNGLAHDCSL